MSRNGLLGEVITAIWNRDISGIPTELFELSPPYPNPFNSAVRINYTMSNVSDVRINIYDIMGRLVQNTLERDKRAGIHTFTWNGRDRSGRELPSGIYFVTLMLNEKPVRSMKLLLIK